MIVFYVKRSKPNQLNVSATGVKSYLFERYIEIERMPNGEAKIKAYAQWQQECDVLQNKVQGRAKELKVKVVDR